MKAETITSELKNQVESIVSQDIERRITALEGLRDNK